MSAPIGTEGGVSVPGTTMSEADLDQLVEAATAPTLAEMFRRGKRTGLIQPTSVYGEAPRSGATQNLPF